MDRNTFRENRYAPRKTWLRETGATLTRFRQDRHDKYVHPCRRLSKREAQRVAQVTTNATNLFIHRIRIQPQRKEAA